MEFAGREFSDCRGHTARRHTTPVTGLVEMIVARDADPGVRVCAEAWAECLRDAGFDACTGDEPAASSAETAVIVEPHLALRTLAHDPVRIASVLKRAVCLSTSRLGSGALGADLPYHRAASASVALSRDAARYLSAHGVPTAHLKPGSHARLRSPRIESRTISVGTHSRYSRFREDILARSRQVLDPYTCDLRISHSALADPPGHLEPDTWLSWLSSLDVLVSLPLDSGPGTDWCEVAPAVMNGAVVLTTGNRILHRSSPARTLRPQPGRGSPTRCADCSTTTNAARRCERRPPHGCRPRRSMRRRWSTPSSRSRPMDGARGR